MSRDFIGLVFMFLSYKYISFTLVEDFVLQSHTTKVYEELFNTLQLNNLVRFAHRGTCSLLQGFFKLFRIITTANTLIRILIREFLSSAFPTNGEAIVEGILSV